MTARALVLHPQELCVALSSTLRAPPRDPRSPPNWPPEARSRGSGRFALMPLRSPPRHAGLVPRPRAEVPRPPVREHPRLGIRAPPRATRGVFTASEGRCARACTLLLVVMLRAPPRVRRTLLPHSPRARNRSPHPHPRGTLPNRPRGIDGLYRQPVEQGSPEPFRALRRRPLQTGRDVSNHPD